MNNQANLENIRASLSTITTMISDIERTLNRMGIEHKPEDNPEDKNLSGPDALMKVFKGRLVDEREQK